MNNKIIYKGGLGVENEKIKRTNSGKNTRKPNMENKQQKILIWATKIFGCIRQYTR